MIHKCTCKSDYQDKKYGPGNRVFNRKTRRAGKIQGVARCTVCSYLLPSTADVVYRVVEDVV